MTCVSPPLKGHNGLYRAHLPVYTTLCFVAVTIQLFSTVAGQSPRPSPSPAPSTSWQGSISTGYLGMHGFLKMPFFDCTTHLAPSLHPQHTQRWFLGWRLCLCLSSFVPRTASEFGLSDGLVRYSCCVAPHVQSLLFSASTSPSHTPWFNTGPREAIDQQQDEGGSPGDAAVEPPPPPGTYLPVFLKVR